jgi:hypothetical protein
MFRDFRALLAAIMLAAGATYADPVRAAASDYRFEMVGEPVRNNNQATITVRLIHVPTGRAVNDAVIFQTRLEMPMQGMGPMAGRLSPAQPDGQGQYRFSAEMAMAGEWRLSLAARVQGESEVVRATLTIRAGR